MDNNITSVGDLLGIYDNQFIFKDTDDNYVDKDEEPVCEVIEYEDLHLMPLSTNKIQWLIDQNIIDEYDEYDLYEDIYSNMVSSRIIIYYRDGNIAYDSRFRL